MRLRDQRKLGRPYGFYLWLNAVWQELRKINCAPKDSNPANTKLDEEAWLYYFNEGFTPYNAIATDVNEGGECIS